LAAVGARASGPEPRLGSVHVALEVFRDGWPQSGIERRGPQAARVATPGAAGREAGATGAEAEARPALIGPAAARQRRAQRSDILREIMATTATFRDAACVVLVRGHGRDLEVYWVRRSDRVQFQPGFMAFPGGKVDAADAEFPVPGVSDDFERAARVCAVR